MKFGKVSATLFIALAAAACTVVVDENPPPRPGPQLCTREYAPVCAVRNGERRTFSNECLAQTSGFRIIADGECRRLPPPRPDACPDIYAPVCAARYGQRQTFDNQCEAEREGFRVIQNGQCFREPRPLRSEPLPPQRPGIVCRQIYAPVCARQGSVVRTFSNECLAEGSGFNIIGEGPC